MSTIRRKRKNFVLRRQQYRRVAEALHNTFSTTIRNNSNIRFTSQEESFNLYNLVEVSNDQNNQFAENTNETYFDNLDLENTCLNNEYNFLHTNSVNLNSSSEIENENKNNENENNVLQKLRQWAMKHNVSRSSLTDLLHILAPYHSSLPLDSRTLLETPASSPNIIKLDTGDFYYFGLEYALIHCLSKIRHSLKDGEKLKISFNIDGLSLFKSTKLQLWPILGVIKNFPGVSPFAISVFCGTAKPKPLDRFLNDFIVELNQLLTHGFYSGKNHFFIEIHSFVCDAPAKAFLKCIKQHTGYSSCDKCIEPGKYYKNKVVFPNLKALKRTNESFREHTDDDHHINQTPLLRLPIDMIKCFPTDYMHNICLGIVRKLLFTWFGGPLKVRLSHGKVNIISERLLSLKKFIPIEFNRTPRSLEELQHWKATEFRFFLIYSGPVVLKNVLNRAVYKNFLLLHFAVSVLLSNKHIENITLPSVRKIINIFINHCKNSLYGLEFIVYNVHLLTHICDDVEVYGTLDEFSAFPFENFLHYLKKLVKSPTNVLQQIYRRITEINVLFNKKKKNNENEIHLNFGCNCKIQHDFGPLIFNTAKWAKQYKKLYLNNFILTIKQYSSADCYCLVDDGNIIIVEIQNIVTTTEDAIFIIGKQFNKYSCFYDYPYDSSQLHIYVIESLSENLRAWPISTICGKCIVFPINCNRFVSFPIIHSLNE